MGDIQIVDRNLTIILASVIPGVAALLLCGVLFYQIQRRRARLFRRGITPIGEEEIQSWKVDKDDEQSEVLEQGTSHHRGNSASSNKPASIIVYNTPGRISEDQQFNSTSPSYRISADIPATPVVARAPNARPGLTDDTIRGDDAFILQPKRQTRLAKHPPVSASSRHHRAWSTRSLSRGASHECWYGAEQDSTLPRHSTETSTRARSRSMHQASNNSTAYSTPTKPPRASFDDEMFLGGLSPRPPVHKSEIGRAIG